MLIREANIVTYIYLYHFPRVQIKIKQVGIMPHSNTSYTTLELIIMKFHFFIRYKIFLIG